MMKAIALILCLTVAAVSADGGWSQYMHFKLGGVDFWCSLLSGGLYTCNNQNKPSHPQYPQHPYPKSHPKPAPKPQPAPQPTPTKPSYSDYPQIPYPKPTPSNPKPVEPTPPTPAPVVPKPPTPAPVVPKPPTPAPTPTPPSGGDDGTKPHPCNSPEWKQAVVDTHNYYRSLHEDTGPLTWSDAVAAGTIEYSQQLINAGGNLEHSHVEGLGENLYQGWDTGCEKAKDIIGYMYAECQQYNWGSPGFTMETGHFSQIVWKDTTEVGAGAYTGSDGKCIVTLRYKSPGNVIGDFGDKVCSYKAGKAGECKAYSR